MERFIRSRSVAAPLPEDDVDTDVIFPARFLLIMEKDGLTDCLFRDRRAEAARQAQPGAQAFVLDRPPFDRAEILVAGDNFGCGSSREHAVWALASFGIRCVIAPSFGEIFHSNCFKNGVLPIVLGRELVSDLLDQAAAERVFEVDLETQTVTVEGESPAAFPIEPTQRDALLNGWDEITLIQRQEGAAIDRFEAQHRARQPWLFE